MQLKLIGQSHPTGLTNNLLKIFEPRPPLEYKPPPEKRKCPPYTGMAQFVSNFAELGDPEYAPTVQEDGVILGADTRATEGPILADKNCEKIHYMAPNIYCCGAGTAVDMEAVTGTFQIYILD
ncbi:hypothetical protein F0562_017976 [Nyssa sinensis]|uniref:U1 small nuclear ribonucleoprotein of 70kDa N-terminal domain-containing protein n=1 Tax=Nyssa sinensis TaxID=561372 RepID=A0A5J4ZBR1_9ASTE|nr:hypothetical protein F0562_017976 [Nyssa sinensis]